MSGRFTKLLQKSVTSITGVTNTHKQSNINGLLVTSSQETKDNSCVTSVTNGVKTIASGYTTEHGENQCNPYGVTTEPSIPAASSPRVTPVTQLHQKNNHYLNHYQYRLTKEVEAFAFQETVLLWIHENPLPIAEGMCAGCGKPITGSQESIAYGGIRTHWHGGDLSKDIHCSKHYIESRKKEAEEALAAMGVGNHA